jgi:hypothetical protein
LGGDGENVRITIGIVIVTVIVIPDEIAEPASPP